MSESSCNSTSKPPATPAAPAAWPFTVPLSEYLLDATQRTIHFWDVLRERGNNHRQHLARRIPHMLRHGAELILDARTFERPANHLLVRTQPPEGVDIDLRKRPFVVDPRSAALLLGVSGGSRLTPLTGDLGAGKFDGAGLVSNFENLDPANTDWSKNCDPWSKVDTEAERFLEFETWWGGHVNLNAAEMQWIVDQRFIGNRLATAEITTSDGTRVDLRNIRSPIVGFCSEGDNITPPQQALGSIVDLCDQDPDIRAGGQTIVHAIHERVGHLGIFVSGGIARKGHQEFASNIDLIDVLPPGIYEAAITLRTAETAGAEFVGGEWTVRFEPRTLADVRAIVQPTAEDDGRFAAVGRLSEIKLGLYRTLLQPFVRACAREQTATRRPPARSWT